MRSRKEEVRGQGESGALVTASQKGRSLIPAVYRRLLSDPQTRRLLLGLGVSALGDGMSTVSICAVRHNFRIRMGVREQFTDLRLRH